MLFEYMRKRGLKLPHQVHMIVAGAPPAPATIRQAIDLGGDMRHVYGLTETYGPHSICEWRKEWNELPVDTVSQLKARQGIPYVGFQMDVFDDKEEGKPVPRDAKTVGEVVMKGHNVVLGYYKDPEKTKESFKNGWFYTGDAAVVHSDEYLGIVDRYKDMINTGGEKVASVEVEKVLMEIPGVKAAAVYGTPDEKWGEVVSALVETKEGATLTAEEVTDFCRARLAHFKCPRIVEFKLMPMTATGKMQKYVLRERAKEEQQSVMATT